MPNRTLGISAAIALAAGILLALFSIGSVAGAHPSGVPSGGPTSTMPSSPPPTSSSAPSSGGGYPPSSPPPTSSTSGGGGTSSSTGGGGSSAPGGSSSVSQPTGGTSTVTLSDTSPQPGQTITIGGGGMDPNEGVSGDIHSAVIHLGDATADPSGNVSMSVTIPESLSGEHTITLTGKTSGHIDSITVNIGGSSGGSGSGGLSATGVAILGIGVFGLLLLAGGGLLLLAGRRQKSSPSHS